jgi:hypothetical protein
MTGTKGAKKEKIQNNWIGLGWQEPGSTHAKSRASDHSRRMDSRGKQQMVLQFII